jgi:hypothetical protein
MNISPHHVVSDFSDSSEEGVLNTIWEKYKNAHDKVILLTVMHVYNQYLAVDTYLCIIHM